jgi:hypothetical protein
MMYAIGHTDRVLYSKRTIVGWFCEVFDKTVNL